MPDQKTVDRAIELISKGRIQRFYFFDKLDDPEWIKPLSERGFFSKPPKPIERDDGVQYPAWPESQYLERMSRVAPALVADVIEDIPGTENFRVRADLLRAAVHLDLAVAERIARGEADWISERAYLHLDYPVAAGSLALHLGEAGSPDAALLLLGRVLEVLPTGQTEGWRPRIRARTDQWVYSETARNVFPGLTEAIGLPSLSLGMDLLEGAVSIGSGAEPPEDYSSIWRPAIEAHRQNVGVDIRDDLIDVLRDTAVGWIDGEQERLQQVVRALARRDWTIFRRLGLYVLSEGSHVAPQEAIAACLNADNYFDISVVHEFLSLSARTFPLMTNEQKAEWLGLLDRGPAWPPRDPEERAAEDYDEEQYERLVKLWRRDRLSIVADALPESAAPELQRLLAELGPPAQPSFARSAGTFMGPTSPRSATQLSEMSPEEIAEYVREWQPTGDVMAPSPEGLSRLISDRVKADPQIFTKSAAAGSFDDVDPTYIRGVINGLEQALKIDGEEVSIDWDGALALVGLAARAPDTPRRLLTGREGRDWDPDWTWCRRDAASLLETAMSRRALPVDEADRAWSALSALSWDPDPTPEHEERYGGANMDPLTMSLNTVRGRAMHAVIQFAVWRKQETPEVAPDLDALTDVAETLLSHLDPDKDPSLTVRAVFGSRLNQLAWLDQAWVGRNLPALFPSEHPQLRQATWEGFLFWGSPADPLLTVLHDEYARAVAQAHETPTTRRVVREISSALPQHLGTYLWWGSLDLAAGGLIEQYVASAPPEGLTQLVDFLGRSLDDVRDGLEPEVALRLIAFWEQFRDWVGSRDAADQATALSPFGWWYGAGALDDRWCDQQLLDLLQQGVTVEPDFRVAARIEERAVEDVAAAVRVIRAVVGAENKEHWRLYGMLDKLRQPLRLGLSADDPDVRDEAKQIVNDLGARGFVEVRDLLQTGAESA